VLVLCVLALFLLTAAAVLLAPAIYLVTSYRRYRGLHVVECPETRAPVEVGLDVRRAAVTTVTNRPRLRLVACSRWPERRDCNQACTRQIETA
jgi:hypothetical protein